MAGKAPAFQFYPGDWLRDTQVQMASMETKGVWIQMLCNMWFSPAKGELNGSWTSLSRLLGCDIETLQKTVKEIKEYGIADVTCNGDVTKSNNDVTIINRRMYREDKARKDTALRVQKHRSKKGGNKDVTIPSSFASPSPKETPYPPDPKTVCDATDLQKKKMQRFEPDYNSHKKIAIRVSHHISDLSGISYPDIPETLDPIIYLLREGITEEECITVVDYNYNGGKYRGVYVQKRELFTTRTLMKKAAFIIDMAQARSGVFTEDPSETPVERQMRKQHEETKEGFAAYKKRLGIK